MQQHSPYYVPSQSAWPILGATALLISAFGSLNLENTWGVIALIVGLAILLYDIGGWFWTVIKESNAGLYNKQMDNTFRWGMFWFLVSEIFLFGLLLGSLFHVRFSITPWLAGHEGDASLLTHYLLWPDFFRHWPLITTPERAAKYPVQISSTIYDAIPVISLFLQLISALLLVQTLFPFKKGKYKKSSLLLNTVSFFGILFLGLQTFYLCYLIQAKAMIQTGIYGSLLIAFLGLHCANSLAALLFFITIITRLHQGQINRQNSFALEAALWWWSLLTVTWILCIFLIL